MLANKGVCHDCLVGHTEMVWCGCGDGYPKGSFDAGYMDASGGICQNCAAAKPQATSDKAPELPIRPVVDWRVWAVGDTVRYLGSGSLEEKWSFDRMTIGSDYLIHEAPDEDESMVVLDDDGDEIGVLVGEFEFVKAGAEPEGLAYVDGKAGDLIGLFSMLKEHAATFGSTDTAMGEVVVQATSEEDKALYAQWVKQAADNPVDDSGALCGG
jgi:hypothetical protein